LAHFTQILKQARQENPSLIISFDPGSEYCRNPTQHVKDAICLSDYLLLNWNEFHQLGNYQKGGKVKRGRTAEKEIAADIFATFECRGATIIVKSSNSIRFFQLFKDTVLFRRFWQVPLLAPSIVDDTGAGDVFIAAFISANLIPALSFDMRTTMLLCSRLVKTKLKIIGCDAGEAYAKIVRQVLEEIDRAESTNLANLGRVYFSEIGGFFLGVFSSTFIKYLLSHFIK
jgi:hypothetical protein